MTQGDTEEEAMAMAEEVLLDSIDWYLEQKKAIPIPSEAQVNDRLIELPVSIMTKVMSLNGLLV